MAKILIADEDFSVREVLAATVSGEGHDVFEASDGQEAIETALREQPDLVFLGAMMPVFNGYETCEMLRNDPEVPQSLPIILVSGFNVDVRARERVGADEAIGVSPTAAELRDLLVRHLGDKANPR